MDNILHTVEWSSYHHAYGTAEDIPEAIRSLGAANTAVREQAYDHLSVTIYHQGSLYSATVPAVKALIQVAVEEQTPDRADILGLVESITESAAQHPGQFALGPGDFDVGTHGDSNPYSLEAKSSAEKEYSVIMLVQDALASQRATLQNLLGDQGEIVSEIVERILGMTREFPLPFAGDICESVYQCLEATNASALTVFAAANPTLTFDELASSLGERISTIQVWWALLTEAQACGDVETFARSTLIREIHQHTRGRGWGVSIHFARICERIKLYWFLRFSSYPGQCQAVWNLLTHKAEKGWLLQHPEEPIIRECFASGWHTGDESNELTKLLAGRLTSGVVRPQPCNRL